jgi:hypothetical protein
MVIKKYLKYGTSQKQINVAQFLIFENLSSGSF